MNVVVIDDDREIGTLLKFALQTRGFKVIHFRSGVEALESQAISLADCIVLDWAMPAMSGEDFLESFVPREGQKIVVYSAMPTEAKPVAEEYGARFVPKGASLYEELIPILMEP